MTGFFRAGIGWCLKLPVHAYRWTLKPLIGWQCRHLPTCSEYALEAIDVNGPWRGGWLALSRVTRCRPGGTDGYDPVPDICCERHAVRPWRYGRWRTVLRQENARSTADPAMADDTPPRSS